MVELFSKNKSRQIEIPSNLVEEEDLITLFRIARCRHGASREAAQRVAVLPAGVLCVRGERGEPRRPGAVGRPPPAVDRPVRGGGDGLALPDHRTPRLLLQVPVRGQDPSGEAHRHGLPRPHTLQRQQQDHLTNTVFFRIRRSVYCREFPDNCKLHDVELTEDEIFNLTLGFQRQGAGRRSWVTNSKDMLVGCSFSGSPLLDTSACFKRIDLQPFRQQMYSIPLSIYSPIPLANVLLCLQVLQPAVRSPPGQLLRVLVRRRTEAQAVRHGAGRLAGQERHGAGVERGARRVPGPGRNPGLIVTLHEDMGMPHVLAHGVHVHAKHTYSLSIEKESVNLLSDPFATNCTDFRQLPFRSAHSMELSPRVIHSSYPFAVFINCILSMMCTVECLLFHQKRECGHSYVTDNVVLYRTNALRPPTSHSRYGDSLSAEILLFSDRDCADRLSKDFRDFCRSLCSIPCHETPLPCSHRFFTHISPTNDEKRGGIWKRTSGGEEKTRSL
ncbi:uncharacterized protein CEXT_87241 [Caerostris extrusa]|uniref:Uncharacterized protein n=1 Tax=Caerostris extrusa TaxID=172846 RepID=A0AAV4T4U7_CAEEX|nr:uncharacterized protein CEXT_87241 [Caerostris extrusa]